MLVVQLVRNYEKRELEISPERATCSILGLIETEEPHKFFSVYPNPTLNHLTIENKTEENYNLLLFDIQGILIYQESLNKTKNIDVSQYESGTYFVKITNANRSFVKKLTIE